MKALRLPASSQRQRNAESRSSGGIRTFGVATMLLLASFAFARAQSQSPDAPGSVPAARFVGTWVGTQAWAIENPPPGANNEQPVTLELELVDGVITGRMLPFFGGEDGATITKAVIVDDELRADAVLGRPRAGGRRGGRGTAPPTTIAFVFRVDDVTMTGTADVKMGDVPWTKFRYELGKKRSRY